MQIIDYLQPIMQPLASFMVLFPTSFFLLLLPTLSLHSKLSTKDAIQISYKEIRHSPNDMSVKINFIFLMSCLWFLNYSSINK